jgi:iron(III) transport system ATP-binding protein
MVFEPRLLLLDEPLSNLDAKLRVHMRTELKNLQQETGITTVFVTHDQAESMALADRIVVMNKGTIEQVGPPIEIYERPANQFVSEFVGSINVFPAEVADVSASDSAPSLVTVRSGARWIRAHAGPAAQLEVGQPVMVSIRPEKLALRPTRLLDGQVNVWEGRVAAAAYYGDHREYTVDVDGSTLRVTTAAAVVVERGADVFLVCDPSDVVVMPRVNGQP